MEHCLMPVAIKGSGGGSVNLTAGAAASDTTLTLPNTTGTVLTTGTAVTAAQGGTGLTSPGAAGNVLTSDGTNWTSEEPAGGLEPGDTLVTARVLSEPEFITTSDLYLKTDFPLVGSVSSLSSGLSWSAVTSGFGTTVIVKVAYGNGVWIAVGLSGTMTRSTNDGVTWSAVTSGFGSVTIQSVAYGNGVWIAVGNSGNMRRSTDDGVTWSAVTSGFGTQNIFSAAYGNGVWVAGGNSGTMTRDTGDSTNFFVPPSLLNLYTGEAP
jgi:hypothetical protein